MPRPLQTPLPNDLTYSDLDVREGLWNCQSAVKKPETILAYAAFQSLTETWIIPENIATPAGLSTAYSFSRTP